MPPETVFIGFGGNVGDRQELCDRAVALMGLLPQSQLLGLSSYYETQPIDPEGVLGHMWFYNGVAKLETALHPRQLCEICQETERALGRDEENQSGPRTMDFDILFYGQQIVNEPHLTIPHPRLHLRRFVLEPLVELDPHWNHPMFHQPVSALLEQLDDPSEVRKLTVIPGTRYGNRPACIPPPFSG
ncbi:MAG: 2-amino-4-hydroxy-6-hydroxymethyldihydropteridine diphosphokinase [Nitrospirales bacterium]|nr:MAG: 2-amino-4-hydroxy-6-hydroxymethyldihydropteridine diphosphokinase [Nitrospirales bacterium]